MTHRYGGAWTDAKLAAISEYLAIYSTALAAQSFQKEYIDAFAGTGRFTHKAGGDERDGSARIALAIGGFDRYTFIDIKRKHARELSALQGEHADRDIRVIHGDANAELQAICRAWPRNRRGVAFIDPYGMAPTWETLEAIRATRAIDVWYLVPLSGFLRQMARDPTRRDGSKERALDRALGTGAWRTELYEPRPIDDLFGASMPPERVNQNRVRSWLTARFESLFPYVQEVAVLRTGSSHSRHGGPALYALYFMMANDSNSAVALARKFVDAVRTKLQRESVLP